MVNIIMPDKESQNPEIFDEYTDAMTSTAPRSSIVAKARRKIFNERGTCLERKVRTPTAKAISVAIGIAQPTKLSSKILKAV